MPARHHREVLPGNPRYQILQVWLPAPLKKNCWVPVPIFSNFWRAGFEFPRILGIPRKSSENHHSSENKIRDPDTNRRRGRLRMIGGMVFEPAVAAVRRVVVVGQGTLNFRGFHRNPGNPRKMSLPETSDPDEEKCFPKISIGQRV